MSTFLAKQDIPASSTDLLSIAPLIAVIFLLLLAIVVILVQRYLLHRVHLLVDYVKGQQQGHVSQPPPTLLKNRDDIALLTGEIYSLLETLRKQNETLREQSLIDPLTGLGNRRLLEQRLEIALPMTRRRMAPLSILMIDVDHFKAYNDHYGHPAGDTCLVEIANVLRDIFRRETDILIRLGGEEFLVVLLDSDEGPALALAEAMRSMLQAVGIPHTSSPSHSMVTVSIGVATAKPGTRIDADSLIACADAALYECKSQGRNRILGRTVEGVLSR
ncbi:GGDEF domain-containing protein [Halomonas sp. GXIMD04776]|uniref:GGDEF domain-containing protein n=1 Tax=Halomonas sp. GXIMD04776 TaxID=3415605 RepID=UPI003CA0DEBE